MYQPVDNRGMETVGEVYLVENTVVQIRNSPPLEGIGRLCSQEYGVFEHHHPSRHDNLVSRRRS
jgi:hypothetical protein